MLLIRHLNDLDASYVSLRTVLFLIILASIVIRILRASGIFSRALHNGLTNAVIPNALDMRCCTLMSQEIVYLGSRAIVPHVNSSASANVTKSTSPHAYGCVHRIGASCLV
eukprot:1508150-Amphidinium_carterae.1